jgi:iron(III) transport system substrate-binding protein
LLLVLLLAACAPGASAPASPRGDAQPPPAAGTGASKQQSEWDRLVAAARQEGKVVVAGPPGDSYRNAVLEFQKQYPGITVEFSGATGPAFAPKVLAERRADQYLLDLFIGGAATGYTLKAEGVFDPIRPALVLPEVLDSSKWQGGFDDGFMDNDGQFVYAFSGYLNMNVIGNRKVIPEHELNNVEQLLDPRWKGKITWLEPRVFGAGSTLAGYWLLVKGEPWLQQLFEQDVVITKDLRQQVEWVVLNRYPIAIAPESIFVIEFQRQGFQSELSWLAPDSPLGSRLATGFGQAMLVNRAPHPNASKVFLNWLLSRDGQAAWVQHTDRNSRRLDVPGPAETTLKQGVSYVNISTEENVGYTSKAIDLATALFR